MKKIILSSILIIASIFVMADDKAYFEAMERNIEDLQKAESAEDFQALANNFERIAEAAPDQWLPYYYTAYSLLNYVFTGTPSEDIDKVLDKAEGFLGKARELSPKNAEIEVLQGWIYQGRIQVDPMGRGMVYSQKAAASFGKAQNYDPENPRIYFMTGQNVLYTPEMFGGGQEAACPYFKKAKEKFDAFTPESSIAPDWGKELNEKLVKDCK